MNYNDNQEYVGRVWGHCRLLSRYDECVTTTRVHVIQNVYITSRCCEVNFEPLHFVDEYNITTPFSNGVICQKC